MTKTFQVAAQLDGVSPLKDGGMSVRFHTQEINKDEKVNLMGYYQQFGWLLFRPDQFEEKDMPEQNTDIEGRKIKTPSQRLRNVIYVYGQKKGVLPQEADVFYANQIEGIIEQYKEKIEEL